MATDTNMFTIIMLLLILTAVVASAALLWQIKSKLSAKEGDTAITTIREEFRLSREEQARANRELREELSAGQTRAIDTLVKTLGESAKGSSDQMERVRQQIKELTESNDARLERVRTTIDTQLKQLQDGNEKKLDEMRKTVDEKLQGMLERRLGESFKLISSQLDLVSKGLGEMQVLATGVGDLKRVLTNVKTRGTWGEVQLGAILEQILTPDQYEKNWRPHPDTQASVEYAIKLPGQGGAGEAVFLPIDAKYPQDDYQRIVDAAALGDLEAVAAGQKALFASIRRMAQDISSKYILPPLTTDFAIMFLPTEGLYAEVLREPGLHEDIQQRFRVVITGPTTLSATLNSLRMGFRTLAIEKHSSEVWKTLGRAKTEFGKFGEILDRVKRQLTAAANTIDETGVRTRVIERTLREVEALPVDGSPSSPTLEDESKE
ncbi:MAG: DNA recombination protein RmuC [Acidobacteriaceae bacterium]